MMNTDQAMGMILGSLVTFIWIASVVWYVFTIIGGWKLFQKAGEPGWKSIIPFYNQYVLYRFSWKAYMAFPLIILGIGSTLLMQYTTGAMYTVGSLAFIAYTVLNIIGYHKISKAFGHGAGYTVGLFFLYPIFIMILGFGKSKYIGIQE
ncbi:DUF5684 domain-containing protein [Eubacterium sp.]|uniref:DUF5684 domain-containing protein n=1 Tax=Eubacterium sp. TaxID=142586 RepID=UPI0026DFBA64|nr:DUF5684 domain-containing protein [Eubacterium sp.]MDO5431972.1 DUF5684 domain-containing protein [Eubacterium sp.]